jgi:hypothetical protein
VPTKIYVKDRDYGFLNQIEIPVVRREEVDEGVFDIVYCNHAGAEEVEEEHQTNNIDAPDMVWIVRALVCLKCHAFKRDGDDYWQDAPVEGEHGSI